MNITTVGIDLAKNVFQFHGIDKRGQVVLRKRLKRAQLLTFMSTLSPCLIGLEACGSAHYWARQFVRLGHEVKLMAPQRVKPYISSNKNDKNDAEGICEAVTRPTMKFVPIKTIEQQDMQALHRIRSQLIQQRTALSNQIRGLLAEYGIVVPQGIRYLRARLADIVETTDNELTEIMRGLLLELYERLKMLDQQVLAYDKKIKRRAAGQEDCCRLMEIEGIGPLIATAFIAAVGHGHDFRNGREVAAWLGLTPRQKSSGEKEMLLGISKRGNSYLRSLLIQGGHSVILASSKKSDSRSQWIQKKLCRSGENKTAVAIANKNARIAWVLLSTGERYRKAA